MVLSTDPGNDTDTQEFCLLIRQGATGLTNHSIYYIDLEFISRLRSRRREEHRMNIGMVPMYSTIVGSQELKRKIY
jgi:hypothetical protein